MKFYHLADLHIGKKVNGYSMIDDQRVLLDQVLTLMRQEKPDALILAGDIYDRRNPTIEAVTLFDQFISQVILTLDIPILAIGGNHDSGERLGFSNDIQAKAGLHLAGTFSWPLPQVRLYDDAGPLDIILMAYADLAVLHTLVPETASMTYAEAMDWILSHIPLDPQARHVLVAHGVVTGDAPLSTCDSERTLDIGGTEFWQSDSLAAFDYVALGHLHQAQTAGSSRIHYAGSLMQYSFSEEGQQKVLLDITIDAKGELSLEKIPLNAPHKLITIQGRLDDLLTVPTAVAAHRNDYLRIVLEDEGSLLEPMQRLKQCYPNIMLMERLNAYHSMPTQQLPSVSQSFVPANHSPLAMFETFYEQMTKTPASEEMRTLMTDIFAEVQKEAL
ncbi:MAG: exonuclease SbcCD subunit D [Peptococcaceae bacterium]|nr:exonuclease SbcCD subunit D [Peptococcaceae bacterium]